MFGKFKLVFAKDIKNCMDCPLLEKSRDENDQKPRCFITKQTLYFSHRNVKRHHNCPLIEIKED